MRYLALFKIKNGDFDFTKYGLSDVFFSIDISNSIQASKGVKTTQYALLDGTTRIDTISRAPGTLNFQGNIGDLFVAKSMERSVKDTGTKNRLELQVELLDALRDNAIVLDVITETKTYKNYIITSIGSGMNKFGINDINIAMKELLMFGDEIEVTEDSRDYLYSTDDEVVDDLPSIALDTFKLNNFDDDRSLINEVVNLVKNSDLTLPYIIQFGASHTSPDIQIKNYGMSAPTLKSTSDQQEIKYTYTVMQNLIDADPQILLSGYVKDDFKIQITIPAMTKGSLTTMLTQSEFVSLSNAGYIPSFVDTGKYQITIKLVQRQGLHEPDTTLYTTYNKDLIVTPRYSDITNGINPLVSNSTFLSDLVKTRGNLEGYKSAMCFLRKCSQNTYRVMPNLLRDTKQGYLYPTFHVNEREEFGTIFYEYNIGFVFIHRDALPKIKNAFENLIGDPEHFMNQKKIVWW